MRRQDVKIGTEYAVRVSNYGAFAHIEILGEMTREVAGRRYLSQPTKERGLEGKLIEGHYKVGFARDAIEKGEVGFVRPRDVSHEWTVEEARRKALAEAEAASQAAMAADEDERRVLAAKMKALGIREPGFKIEVEQGYSRARRRDYEIPEHLPVRREALAALIEKAAGS